MRLIALTAAVAAAAGTVAIAAPANAAKAPHACSFTGDKLSVRFGHDFKTKNKWTVPLVVRGTKKAACTLSGRATIKLLDRKGHVIAYHVTPGAKGHAARVDRRHDAVIWLHFTTGKSSLAKPVKIRVTLPRHGGSKTVAWKNARPASHHFIKVDGPRQYLD